MDQGKLFVGGISWDTNEDDLREHFSQFGEVAEAVIMKDRNSGRTRGFGFVVFAHPAVAERVFMDKNTINGRTVNRILSTDLMGSRLLPSSLELRLWLKWRFLINLSGGCEESCS